MRRYWIGSEPLGGPWNRRRWLAAALTGTAATALGRGRPARAVEEDKEVAQIQELARKAGLGPFRSSTTEHYLGIGDAPDAYREEALKRCAGLARAFHAHFQDKGFDTTVPPGRLTVVTLKDQNSYAALLGNAPGADVGGHYDLETNRLFIFDFRPGVGLAAGADPRRVNTFTLIHEATHQLTFSAGLLDRAGDVPAAVSEGLATYAELWRGDSKTALGMINRPRLDVLFPKAGAAPEWIPLDKLLTDDGLFQKQETEQRAYGQAWVLVHYALRTTAVLPRFRSYLDAIRPRRAPAERLTDARAALGDLQALHRELRKHAARALKLQ
jgi:hypothetical protein